MKDLLKQEFIVAFIDFGESVIVRNNEKFKNAVGTLYTMAPEVFYLSSKNKEHFELKSLYQNGYGFAADVYSLAVTMLLIESKNEVVQIYESFQSYRQSLLSELGKRTGGAYNELLNEMLKLDFTERPKIEKVLCKFSKVKNEESKPPEQVKHKVSADFVLKGKQQSTEKIQESCKMKRIIQGVRKVADVWLGKIKHRRKDTEKCLLSKSVK